MASPCFMQLPQCFNLIKSIHGKRTVRHPAKSIAEVTDMGLDGMIHKFDMLHHG